MENNTYQEKKAYDNGFLDEQSVAFTDSINRLGRITSLIALVFMFMVPLGTMWYFDIEVDFGAALAASSGLITIFLPMAVIENISYYPIMGAGGIYLASVTGNVLNMKLPSVISGQKIAEVEPGTQEGDVVSIISVGVSSIVTTAIVFGGLLIGQFILPILNAPILAPGFANIIPSLLGAVAIPNLVNNKKISITPIILALVAYTVIGPARFPFVQSYVLVAIMLTSILVSYRLYKSEKL